MIARLTVSISDELRRRVRAKAEEHGESVSDVVRAALESYIGTPTPAEELMQVRGEKEDPAWTALGDHELTEDDPFLRMIGRVKDGPTDMSANKHAYATD